MRPPVRATIVVTCCAMGPAFALVAHASPLAISERDFVSQVKRADPGREALEADVDSARAEVAGARVLANPVVSYDREETFQAGEGLPEQVLRADWTIDISGARGRRIAGAELGVAATRADVALRQLELEIDARRVYREAACIRLRAELLRGQRTTLARLVGVVQKRTRAGDAAGYDLQRLELELGNYDDLLASVELDLGQARRRLALLAGQPGGALEPSDSLPIPAEPTSGAQVDVAGRLDHQTAKLRHRQADAELAAARRGWVPRIGIGGGMKWIDLGNETANGYVAGISLALPLFDHGEADALRARAAARRAAAELRRVEQRTAGAVGPAREDLVRRIAQAKAFESRQMVRLDGLLRAAEASYREGERPIGELLEAYRTARETRLRALELRRDAAIAELELAKALGRGP